jgi:NAD(P)-dependent dehydrogenase (short-subunit alcohol dehydrogenase family)
MRALKAKEANAMGQLDGRAAAITGGSSGIGRATALALAAEGCAVAVGGRKQEALESAAAAVAAKGGRAVWRAMDARDEAQVTGLIDDAVREFGRLDIMVNNAGVSRRDWDTTIAVNLSGVYYGCKHAAVWMAEHGGGSIINLASILGLVGIGTEDPYVAAKHGVVGLTRNFAIAYARRGVRVNCLNPGFIETPMTENVMETPALRQTLETQTPMGRMGRPEEVAKCALFLASDEASYVTGAPLIVDGGWTAR